MWGIFIYMDITSFGVDEFFVYNHVSVTSMRSRECCHRIL